MELIDASHRLTPSAVEYDTSPPFLSGMKSQERLARLVINFYFFCHGSCAITASQLAISSVTLRISSSNSAF